MIIYQRLLLVVIFILLTTLEMFGQISSTADSLKKDSSHTIDLWSTKPKKWAFIYNVPDDLLKIAKSPFEKRNLAGLIAVTASSVLLIWQDQKLSNGAKDIGKAIHWNPDTQYKVLVKIGNTKIVKMPLNINTALYQFGEGATSMLLAGGFFVYGKLSANNRALQTASDVTETFLNMGIADQIMKRCFGRQSPFMATKSGGRWHPFPSFKDYQQNTSNYDGFPSGHLASLMATVTVISANYPEKIWIKPVGYLMIGLVGFAMMNTEVHWAGDYPVGLALGYLSGKITAARHQKRKSVNTFCCM